MSKKRRKLAPRKKTSPLSAVRLSHPFAVIVLGLTVLFAAANIQTTQQIAATTQNVLGEDEENEGQKQAEEAAKETAKQADQSQKEAAKQAEEQQKQLQEQQKETAKQATSNSSGSSGSSSEVTKAKTEKSSSSGFQMKIEKESNKQETEIETADGQKIKTKIEDDGTTKVEVENGTVKLKYRVENGQVMLEAENEAGEEVDLEEDELKELDNAVQDELEDEDIKLQPTTDERMVIAKNQVAAVTDYPLSINVATKELIITTPAGQKVVTVLPDEAVQTLLTTGVINKVEPPPADSVPQGQLGTFTGVVTLAIRDNEVVYKVNGEKTHRMLGFIPVTTPVTAYVSADTGKAVAKQQSILTNIVDFLSP